MTAPQPPGMPRHDGIGASEVAAILGCDKWRTPWQVWAVKRGGVEPFEGNAATHWGTVMEAVIADEWEAVTGRGLRRAKTVALDGWAFASVDRLTVDTGEIIEIKTARYPDGWGEDGGDEVPRGYFLQWQFQSALTGIESGELVVLIGGNDFRRYPMTARPALQASMLAKGRAWWERHIRDGEEPPLTGTAGESSDLAGLWDGTSGNIVNGGPAGDELAAKLKRAREEASRWNKIKTLRENEIKQRIGGDAGLVGPGYEITWKPNARGVRTLRAKFDK